MAANGGALSKGIVEDLKMVAAKDRRDIVLIIV
jgi:hypothetical protein